MIGVAPKRDAEILKELERFATLYPDHAEAQFYYGLSLVALQDKKAAETYFRKAVQLDAAMPQPHVELGKLLADKGSGPEAIQELETAVRLAPDVPAAHYRLAQLYRRTGQKTRADHHFAAYRKLQADQAAREEQERRHRARLTVAQ
jgi:Flp pilus assembly protein TadD